MSKTIRKTFKWKQLVARQDCAYTKFSQVVGGQIGPSALANFSGILFYINNLKSGSLANLCQFPLPYFEEFSRAFFKYQVLKVKIKWRFTVMPPVPVTVSDTVDTNIANNFLIFGSIYGPTVLGVSPFTNQNTILASIQQVNTKTFMIRPYNKLTKVTTYMDPYKGNAEAYKGLEADITSGTAVTPYAAVTNGGSSGGAGMPSQLISTFIGITDILGNFIVSPVNYEAHVTWYTKFSQKILQME